ncbi:hypothetical protein GCM10010185_51730 [Saccharothrix coeruleofusca]|uniref:Uncharacterized protein n=1 Tax=Saccharothrix coeruleofusca TaxID=33919 RepID=A0A918AQX0_9PSEU|nr:hypothetical protein GCM10010185_51730 [Saccharothrix coeruleofusca]
MPSIADLHRVGQSTANRLGVGGRAVPAYHFDTGMPAQPRFQGGGVAAGQDRDASAGLGVDDDRGVAVAAAQGEIVHADHPWNRQLGQWQASQTAQRGAAGHRHGEYSGQPCDRPAT